MMINIAELEGKIIGTAYLTRYFRNVIFLMILLWSLWHRPLTHEMFQPISRTSQPLTSQELIDHTVTPRLVIVEIKPVAGVGLDISREIIRTDLGEIGCYGGGDGWEGRVAGGETVAAAEGEVVRLSKC